MPNHDAKGKFAPGNKASTGNSVAKRTAKLRAKLLDAAEDRDAVTKLFDELLRIATASNEAAYVKVNSAKLLLEYLLGRPDIGLDVLDELHQLAERLVDGRVESHAFTQSAHDLRNFKIGDGAAG